MLWIKCGPAGERRNLEVAVRAVVRPESASASGGIVPASVVLYWADQEEGEAFVGEDARQLIARIEASTWEPRGIEKGEGAA